MRFVWVLTLKMSFAPFFMVIFIINELKYVGIRSFKAIKGISLFEVHPFCVAGTHFEYCIKREATTTMSNGDYCSGRYLFLAGLVHQLLVISASIRWFTLIIFLDEIKGTVLFIPYHERICSFGYLNKI